MPEAYIKKILDRCQANNPGCDLALIEKANAFAQEAHRGQKRASGEPYVFHALATAEILTDLKVDSKSIAAGLLHDVLDEHEDAELENLRKQLEKEFGKETTNLVWGVTKSGKIKYRGVERAVENLRKMFLAIAQDIRVVIIKLADRLHNMRTLAALPPEKQLRIARETMDIYAPLADRLGIGRVKGELEDLAFKYLMPGEYQWLTQQVRDKLDEREKYLSKIVPELTEELQKEGVKPLNVYWRAKHYYSLYKKLKRYEMNLNQIYDLVALRIIVPSVEDCYATLGLIHKLWRPLPGRIKDYIALPKPNGYQSLHTTVFCQGGKITEIQIRTPQMHEEAERGIAAHWYYSEQKGLKAYIKKFFMPAPERELKWIKQLQEWQKEGNRSPEEFFQSLKIDFFKDRIFVFTPKGDVIDLPEGATPIDFAYHIHTDIGHRCQGAKVDGRLVSLDTPLSNGQVVEIITQKQAHPSRDWLKMARTHQTQNRIKQWLNRYRLLPSTVPEEKKELPKIEQPRPLTSKQTMQPIAQVIGNQDIPTVLAKCCSPQPPDPISGYITLNQRITVHRTDCRNLAKAKDRTRLVEVTWKRIN